MRFIQLTGAGGIPAWVDPNAITCLHRVLDLMATRVEVGGFYVCVKETPEQVLAMLNEPAQHDGLLPGWRVTEAAGKTGHFYMYASSTKWRVVDESSGCEVSWDFCDGGRASCLNGQKAAQAKADRLEAELKAKEADQCE